MSGVVLRTENWAEVCEKMDLIRNQTAQELKGEIGKIKRTFLENALLEFLVQGYAQFSTKVRKEFGNTPDLPLAEMLLADYETFFYSERQLKGEIRRLVTPNS